MGDVFSRFLCSFVTILQWAMWDSFPLSVLVVGFVGLILPDLLNLGVILALLSLLGCPVSAFGFFFWSVAFPQPGCVC